MRTSFIWKILPPYSQNLVDWWVDSFCANSSVILLLFTSPENLQNPPSFHTEYWYWLLAYTLFFFSTRFKNSKLLLPYFCTSILLTPIFSFTNNKNYILNSFSLIFYIYHIHNLTILNLVLVWQNKFHHGLFSYFYYCF